MLRHRERLVRLSLSLFILFHAITQSTARGYKMSSGTFDFFVRRGETKGENVFFKKVTHIIILRCAPGNWRKGKNGNGARVITIFRNVIKCKKEGEKERKKKKWKVQSNGIGLLASSPFSYALDCVPLHTLPFVVIIRIAGFVIQNLFSNSPGPSRISPRD